jgi:hypothetical protein
MGKVRTLEPRLPPNALARSTSAALLSRLVHLRLKGGSGASPADEEIWNELKTRRGELPRLVEEVRERGKQYPNRELKLELLGALIRGKVFPWSRAS